jgi:hypothetical protein
VKLGDVAAAENALAEVVRRDTEGENFSNALIDLMHCASTRHDRVGFERWRERCLEQIGQSAPNLRTDFALKTGIGYARFGNYRRAGTALREALEIATAHGLHEFVFRIERMLAGLNDCGAPDRVESAAVEPVYQTESLRKLSASRGARQLGAGEVTGKSPDCCCRTMLHGSDPTHRRRPLLSGRTTRVAGPGHSEYSGA